MIKNLLLKFFEHTILFIINKNFSLFIEAFILDFY